MTKGKQTNDYGTARCRSEEEEEEVKNNGNDAMVRRKGAGRG
jgi:hypothetical protein